MDSNSELHVDTYKEISPYKVNVSDIKFQGNPDTLSNFPQWVWYTIAAPALWGGLDDEVLSIVQQETSLTYHRRVFDKPIFSGFNLAWNHTLWAVQQVEWLKLKNEFLSVTKIDTSAEVMVKYGMQELTIFDPIHMDNTLLASPTSPTHVIYAFGVMSNVKTVAFNPAQSLVECPRVYTFKPEQEIVTLADKVLEEQQTIGEAAIKMGEL